MKKLISYLASGVNSPIPTPAYYPKSALYGKGAYVYCSDGRKYLDLWMGYGALLFGHTNPYIAKAIRDIADSGWLFTIPTELDIEVARLLHDMIPSAERVRFSTTGSDGVAYAIRCARANTKRKRILSIIGGYHGVHEGVIKSDGVLPEMEKSINKIPFNDVLSVKKALKTGQYAAFLLEPVLANSGCVPPEPSYLTEIRELCTETDTLLIFDETVTGFRLSSGGAQKYFKVTPDISTFSKAIANGLPISAVCGREDLMKAFIPSGKVFFAGTFNANPLSLAAAKATLEQIIKNKNMYTILDRFGIKLRAAINETIEENKINACIQGIGSMLTIAFGCHEFKQGILMTKYDNKSYDCFVKKGIEKGLMLPPLATETLFPSLEHVQYLDMVIKSISEALIELQKETRSKEAKN